MENLKLGLALSGGGFRAAFFHLGVLARMADMGLLRYVEVISTVSGGSIIGALYYLHVKRLLEAKSDGEITDRDYRLLVKRMIRDFLQGVQRNIRMRTFLNPGKILRMSGARYSRTERIGELYDEVFYRPVFDPGRKKPVKLQELVINPRITKKGEEENCCRRAKIPLLLINATTLNTGHNWRFTPREMGEPERRHPMAAEVDKNSRLKVVPARGITLGEAVAASTCVPGLFPPLCLSDYLYSSFRIRLVDGGVHDNLGVEGLLDTGCSCFIVSDASAQMPDDPDPDTSLVGVLNRSTSILADRLREEELFRLLEGNKKPVAFIHLRKGLAAQAIAGRKGNPCPGEITRERCSRISAEGYGVHPRVQELLSRIRTDLDAFTEVEAFSLMLDGYLISGVEFSQVPELRKHMNPLSDVAEDWDFCKIRPWMGNPTPDYLQQLEVAGEMFFKVFRLSRVSLAIALVLAGTAAGAVYEWQKENLVRWLSTPITAGQLLLGGVMLGLGFIPRLSRVIKGLEAIKAPFDFVVRLAVKSLLPLLGSIGALLVLGVLDPVYLSLGKVERLTPFSICQQR